MSFAEIFEWFDHTYIVNLPYRHDRRAETKAELARVGVEVPSDRITFFEAYRPREEEKGEFVTIGSLGNFLSQTRVLKNAMDRGHNRILVCEDDLRLNPLPEETIAAVLHDLRTTEWSIASLGYLQPVNPRLRRVGLNPWSEQTIGCQFWAIQGDAIRKFHDYLELARSRPRYHPDGGAMYFDGAFNMVRTHVEGITFRLANPSLAGQRSSRTDIHPLRFYDRVEPFRSVVSAVRRVKNNHHWS